MMTARAFVRWTVCVFALLTLVALHVTGLTWSLDGIGFDVILLIGSSLACGQVYKPCGNRNLDKTVYGLENIGLFSLVTIIGTLASYATAAISKGWIDKYLIAGDRALGIDWLAYWSYVQLHPALGYALRVGYMSIFPVPIIWLLALASAGQIDRCYRFVAAFTIALIVTDLSLILFPAHSAEAYFLGVHADLPQSGLIPIPIIEGLRNGSLRTINLADMKGLIAFPSFHAASCVLFLWGSWSVRWLRGPSLIINSLMLASTPLQGGHYFVDVLAGIGVGVAAIAASERMFRTASGQHPAVALPPLPFGWSDACRSAGQPATGPSAA